VTGISAGLIGVVAFPLWGVFDYLVAPDHAMEFVLLRLAFTVPLLAICLALLGPLGRRRPEALMLAMMLAIEVAIALMVVRLDSQHAAYAMGMTLPLFAAAFLLVWSWRYTLALAVLGLLALVVATLTAADPPGTAALTTVGFYVVTASLLACVAQLHRERLAWREFCSRAELEQEQARNLELVDELARLSHEDPLTGLANRRAWDQALSREVEAARAQDGDLALLLWDVDDFKAVNDELGHATGDAVLVAAGRSLAEGAGDTHTVARLGGDEFAVLCPGLDAGGAAALADRLCQAFAHLTERDPAVPVVTCSVGTAAARGQTCSASDLMLRADERLYHAKRARDDADERERRL
jgi:diguanylate cyclase (GGDEF)-like protein